MSTGLAGYPDTAGWAHHDITALPDGRLVTAHPADGQLLVLAPDGRLETRLDIGVTESHGVSVVPRGTALHLLVADNGHRFVPDRPRYRERTATPRALEITMEGAVVCDYAQPDSEDYASAPWSPTALMAMPAGPGAPAARVWVADGYGRSLIHLYDESGDHTATLDGSASGRPLDTPHALLAVDGRDGVEVYVADRGNDRIVVFGPDGSYRRVLADGLVRTPASLALEDGTLWVAELDGGLAALTREGEVTGRWGTPWSGHSPTWPNDPAQDGGGLVAPHLLESDLVSPHGVTVDGQGRILVTEWTIGGRIVVLDPVATSH